MNRARRGIFLQVSGRDQVLGTTFVTCRKGYYFCILYNFEVLSEA